jgi:hypothetical protein
MSCCGLRRKRVERRKRRITRLLSVISTRATHAVVLDAQLGGRSQGTALRASAKRALDVSVEPVGGRGRNISRSSASVTAGFEPPIVRSGRQDHRHPVVDRRLPTRRMMASTSWLGGDVVSESEADIDEARDAELLGENFARLVRPAIRARTRNGAESEMDHA